jgi:hypothetical protein
MLCIWLEMEYFSNTASVENISIPKRGTRIRSCSLNLMGRERKEKAMFSPYGLVARRHSA